MESYPGHIYLSEVGGSVDDPRCPDCLSPKEDGLPLNEEEMEVAWGTTRLVSGVIIAFFFRNSGEEVDCKFDYRLTFDCFMHINRL